MSSDPMPGVASSANWPALGLHERRVLGVLVEKAKTTPDAYPLSLNSIETGSNQKSNRDPIMNLADYQIEEALLNAQKKGLVAKITGSRVERWRHLLYDSWRIDKVELAILGELLLRGPQTEGELRGRASRMEPIADLESLRATLKPMTERRLVVYLTPEGRRGTTLTHGFHAPEELENLRRKYDSIREEFPSENVETSPGPVFPEPRPAQLESRLNEALEKIQTLQNKVASMEEQVRAIRESLGI
jgi:uncharacterized protein YceH (UPF0502 family)